MTGRTMTALAWLLVGTVAYLPSVTSFLIPTSRIGSAATPGYRDVACWAAPEDLDLKAELTKYLEKRKEANADEEAKKEVGRVIGGTKGNVILDYVSGSPNKQVVIDQEPNIFDYDQLDKYGFGFLAKPIMENGGRSEMYSLMGLAPPPIPEKAKPKKAPKLVIDRTGETDKARYTGLKMGQILDDDEMARALEDAQKKAKAGERLRPKLEEEDFVLPFADNPNKGPRMTPDVTPEMLDEAGKMRGEAIAWARKARAGEFKKDPFEDVAVEGALRVYCIFVTVLVSFAFGRATPTALSLLGFEDSASILGSLQAPAFAFVLAGIGSSIVAGVILAPTKNRSSTTWFLKGLFGGPLALLELKGLDELKTRGEE